MASRSSDCDVDIGLSIVNCTLTASGLLSYFMCSSLVEVRKENTVQVALSLENTRLTAGTRHLCLLYTSDAADE